MENEFETDEQEMMEMYAEYHHAKSMQGYEDWLYKNVHICNGNDLVEALENGQLQNEYLRDVGLPSDTELE